MPTRRQLFCARSFALHMYRLNGWMWNIEHFLQDTDPGTGQQLMIPVDPNEDNGGQRPYSFTELRNESLRTVLILLDEVIRINDFLAKVDLGFLDEGLIGLSIQRADMENDLMNIIEINGKAKEDIPLTKIKPDLAGIAADFISYIPITTWRPLPGEQSVEFHNLNVINDLLDAMSYEMRGINCHNGQAWSANFKTVKNRIEMRLRSFNRYMSRTPESTEKTHFDLIAQVIQTDLANAKNLNQLFAIANYIDVNVEKLVIVRRYWAL